MWDEADNRDGGKVRRQVPWAGPPPPGTREESCSPH